MALKPLNSVGGFSVGEVPANVILPNADITANKGTFVGNVAISNTNPAYGILTDNLYYSNGVPWDLQQAAGNNNEIQFNLNDDFSASPNFTFDSVSSNLTVTGNANVTGTFNAGNIITNSVSNGSSNLAIPATGGNVNISVGGVANVLVTTTSGVNVTGTLNATGNLTVPNANLGNLATANYVNVAQVINGNVGNFSGNVTVPNLTVNLELQANTANFDGNVIMDNWLTVSNTANVGNLRTDNLLYANGVPWDLQEAAGNNNEIQFNINDNFAASANLTYNDGTQQFTVLGNGQFNNANLGNLGTANFANIASNTITGNLTVNNAIAGNTANFTGNVVFNGANVTVGNVLLGNTANFSGNVIVPNLTVNSELSGNTANFTGNINSALNANLGNLVTANFVNVASNLTTSNATVNLALVGNTANFSGNVVVPNLTVNLELAGNTANFSGNVIAANFTGALANGNSNVKVYGNANVEISINGTANIATFTGNTLLVVGNIQSTAGNMLANGNVSANGFLNAANANVTGEANLGSVLTSNITASGNLTITASGTNENIILVPTGTGAVDVSLKNIVQVAAPVNPNDAATKEYVDNNSKGLTIHTAVRVTSVTNLNATYANGGSVLTTIAISGGKTIQFSAAHGLSVGDELAWDNSFNGIIGDDPYFVFSTPASDTITVKAGYFGAEVTTLTNGTGLSQTARANTGVGATLTNAGANAALSIDSVALASTNRVLVQGQTNQFENGIYTVTTVGDGSTAWVLTRATDEDTYSPVDTSALGYGDYFFVQQGTSYAGSSYVLTTPVGEILFGYTNILFSQFSAAGSFTAGNGIAITGTVISANVDGVTTDIVGGNIVVKSSANLTTPNLGDATFSSLSWNNQSNGNVTANNLSIGNIANITLDLTVGGNVQVSGNIDSNANIYSNNSDVSNFLTVGANITGNNITSNNLITTTNANVSANLVTSNATINLALVGNTANFSGNVIVPNLAVNLELAGNTANFTGNIAALNTNAGNLLTANFANFTSNVITSNLTVNLELAGNTANFTGNLTSANANLGNLAIANFFTGVLINGTSNVTVNNNGNINLQAGGNTTAVITATGANITGYANITGNVTANNLSLTNDISANIANITTRIDLGNTDIGWGTFTTTSITANQTVATFAVSGVTGVEFLVKGIDSSGSKYSVATVQAVTDGSNVDYSTFATVNLGGTTGTLAVNIAGSNISLQVTPSSTNSTVWTTQFRTI